MNSVYTALLGANGYYKIKLDSDFIAIYTSLKSLTVIDFNTLNPADFNNFEIMVEIVEDIKEHKLTNGLLGSYKELINIKRLGSFNRIKS